MKNILKPALIALSLVFSISLQVKAFQDESLLFPSSIQNQEREANNEMIRIKNENLVRSLFETYIDILLEFLREKDLNSLIEMHPKFWNSVQIENQNTISSFFTKSCSQKNNDNNIVNVIHVMKSGDQLNVESRLREVCNIFLDSDFLFQFFITPNKIFLWINEIDLLWTAQKSLEENMNSYIIKLDEMERENFNAGYYIIIATLLGGIVGEYLAGNAGALTGGALFGLLTLCFNSYQKCIEALGMK